MKPGRTILPPPITLWPKASFFWPKIIDHFLGPGFADSCFAAKFNKSLQPQYGYILGVVVLHDSFI